MVALAILGFQIASVAEWFSSRATNATVGKATQEAYHLKLTFRDGSVQNTAMEWRTKGAGRNGYEVNGYSLGMKLYATSPQWNSNKLERDAFLSFGGTRPWRSTCPRAMDSMFRLAQTATAIPQTLTRF